MPIPQLQMNSTKAQLGYDITPIKQMIEQPQAEMSIEQPKAVMNIYHQQPRLTIDQTKAREDVNLFSAIRLNEKFAQEGYQAWLQSLANAAEEGKQLLQIESGGNPIAMIAKQNTTRPIYQSTLAFIPSHGSVQIHYEPGSVEVDIQPQKVNIQVQTHKPAIDYIPGSISYYMKQYQSLNFFVANQNPFEMTI